MHSPSGSYSYLGPCFQQNHYNLLYSIYHYNMYDILELSKKLLPELKDIAKELKIKKAESLKKQDLIYKILDQQAIEATEINIQPKTESEEIPTSAEVNNQEPDSALRRGKRPRTLKPVVKIVRAH